MATLGTDRGIYCIRWLEGRKRQAISLSGKKFSKATAEELCRIVEKLVYLKENPTEIPDKRTKAWLEEAHPLIQEKLAKAELIVMPQSHTTGELWKMFLESKNGIKQTTRDGYTYAEQRFFAFFGRKIDLRKLTPEQFKDWKDFLRTDYRSPRTGKPLVTSTVAGTITKTKAVFNWAKAKKWITESPLDEVGRGSFVNKENDRFVTMDEYRRLLDACPCLDWRVIIALARIGGLRCPSELLRLRWTDVIWGAKGRFYVTASKTERYKGHEGRLVPLWPALYEELERLFFAQPEGTEFVINRYRDPERTNLGTQFARIVKMAGIEEIKRPFDNMRASRSTEVFAEYGAFLESKWIGHSTKTAMKHYLQVREEDFERAVGGYGGNGMSTDRENIFPATRQDFPATGQSDSGHISGQQGAAIGCKESQQEKAKAS